MNGLTYLNICMWQYIWWKCIVHHYICLCLVGQQVGWSRTPALVSFFSLTPSSMDHKDLLPQPPFTQLLPLSQTPNPADIPWEHSSWEDRETGKLTEDLCHSLLPSKSCAAVSPLVLQYNPSCSSPNISCVSYRPPFLASLLLCLTLSQSPTSAHTPC